MGHLNRQLIDADLFGVPDPDNISVARPDFLPLGPEGHALGARISGFDPERTKQSLSGLNGQAVLIEHDGGIFDANPIWSAPVWITIAGGM